MAHPTELHHITCDFGTPGTWEAGYHTGRDYRAREPSPVFATRAGKVLHAGWGGWGGAYGMQVIVQTGAIKHMYGHLSMVNCQAGQEVLEGEQVALSGRTSNVTIPFHLHYEERVGPFGYMNHRRPEFDRTESGLMRILPPRKKQRVNLGKVITAFETDPDRAQGDGVHPVQIRPVEMALLSMGLLDSQWAMDGYAGTRTRDAYRAFQRSLGFTGKDADGIPGEESLRELGKRFGFIVFGSVPRAQTVAVPSPRRATQNGSSPVWCPMATRDLIEGQTETAPWSSSEPRWKGLLHTTEGPSYASARGAYLDGGVPHFTIAPNFRKNRGEIFQHFPLSSRATALRDNDSTLKENRAHVIQIEIVGTCDGSKRDTFPDGLFLTDWPTWYLTAIGRLMRWLEEHRGIAPVSTVEWKSFANGSFGKANGVRMTNSQYVAYSGWLGHEHVPENDHGDPGDIDIIKLLAVKPKVVAAPKDVNDLLPMG